MELVGKLTPMPVIKHYPIVGEGDDIPARTILLERVLNNNVVSLEGATITFTVTRGRRTYMTKDNAANGGVTVVDAATGAVSVGPYDTDSLTPGHYDYNLHVEYADGLEVTMVAGGLPIEDSQWGKYKETEA